VPDQRLRIGQFEVDLAAREVIDVAESQSHRITDKARAVLVELIAAQGQVVKRDWLMDRVWAGTYPTGDVLTQAVTTLRKAFRDDAEHPRYIETISKTGYRLLADVAVLDKPVRPLPSLSIVGAAGSDPLLQGPALAPESVPVRTTRWRLWALIGGVALATAAGFGWWRESTRSSAIADAEVPTTPSSSERMLIQPAIIAASPDHEYSPRLSPDGTRVVYSSIAMDADHARLIIQAAVPGGGQLVLTDSNDNLSDTAPAWSGDGQQIAFVRRGSGNSCRIMSVSSVGGLPRALGDCARALSPALDLAPDGKRIVMPLRLGESNDAVALHELDPATGQWTLIDYSRQEGDMDFDPRYSPDGRFIAFRRGLSAGDLWVIPATGGEARRVTHIAADIRGLDFTPDGKALVFSAVQPSGLALHHVDLESGAVGDASLEWAVYPDVSPGGQIVFERNPERLRLRPVVLGAAPTDESVFSSSATDMMVAFSPDGQRAAFYSDRSGSYLVWIVEVAHPERAAMVPDLMPVARFAPSWSPDSTRLIVNGSGPDGLGLYEINADGVRAAKLPLPEQEYRFGHYVGERLLIGWVGDREGELGLFERDGGLLRESARRADVAAALYDEKRQRILFTKVGRSGLFAMDLTLNGEHNLLEHIPTPQYYRRWLMTATDDLLIADYREETGSLWRAPLGDIRAETLVRIEHPFPSSFGLAMHPDGRLVASVMDGQGSDIGFLKALPPFESRD